MRYIKIEDIHKIEGHAGFVGKILDGKIKEAKFEVQQGIRLIEELVVNRLFEDAPILTARICGVCPVVHNLTSIKALEAALGITPSSQTIILRKLMLLGQIIQSHTVHAYFMALPDFFKIRHDVDLIKKFPQLSQKAIKIRKFGNDLITCIGGRSVHPLTTKVGGFTKFPEKENLEKLLRSSDKILKVSYDIASLFKKIKIPNFLRKTEFIALSTKKEYAIYNGNIISTKGLNIPPKKFENEIKEIQKPYEVIKRVEINHKPIFPSALARLNLNAKQLSTKAKKVLKDYNLELPSYNTFHNTLAQVIEIVHCVEEAQTLLKKVLKTGLKGAPAKKFKIKAGKGAAAIEAPRGTLYHYYELDNKGIIRKSNFITPTAQFVSNLEEDIKEFLPRLYSKPSIYQRNKIRMLIRAYDPCMTCSVH